MKKILIAPLLLAILPATITPGAVRAQPYPPPGYRQPYQGGYPGYYERGPGRIPPPYMGTLPRDREYNRDIDRYWSGPRGGPPPCVMYGTC
jgi:hypothetical protein